MGNKPLKEFTWVCSNDFIIRWREPARDNLPGVFSVDMSGTRCRRHVDIDPILRRKSLAMNLGQYKMSINTDFETENLISANFFNKLSKLLKLFKVVKIGKHCQNGHQCLCLFFLRKLFNQSFYTLIKFCTPILIFKCFTN